jgi:hypothetical protein
MGVWRKHPVQEFECKVVFISDCRVYYIDRFYPRCGVMVSDFGLNTWGFSCG